MHLPLAHAFYWFWPIIPIAWLLVFFLFFRFFCWGRRPRSGYAREILAERYARGEIDEREYGERLDRLGR